MLHIPPTNYHLLAAKQELYQKAFFKRKILKNFLEKIGKWLVSGRKWASRQGKRRRRSRDRKSNGSRQKNKKGGGKAESNDSPEIPDKGEDMRHPGLPSGRQTRPRAQRGTLSSYIP